MGLKQVAVVTGNKPSKLFISYINILLLYYTAKQKKKT
jgi:hypothetical protein